MQARLSCLRLCRLSSPTTERRCILVARGRVVGFGLALASLWPRFGLALTAPAAMFYGEQRKIDEASPYSAVVALQITKKGSSTWYIYILLGTSVRVRENYLYEYCSSHAATGNKSLGHNIRNSKPNYLMPGIVLEVYVNHIFNP